MPNQSLAGPSPHPIRGIAENHPYDYPLTARGFLGELRVGVICPAGESKGLRNYLQNVERSQVPGQKEQEYLIAYPGFQAAIEHCPACGGALKIIAAIEEPAVTSNVHFSSRSARVVLPST